MLEQLQPFTSGQIAILPLAVAAVGFLVKWWISGVEKSIRDIASAMAKMAEEVGVHSREIAVLRAYRDQMHEDLKSLREGQHDLASALQRLEGKLVGQSPNDD